MTVQPLHNEKLLLQRIAAGDQQAYTQLYTHYLPRLYRYVYPFVRQSHEETEEILQDIFFKIWLRKETLPALSSFEPYLLRMTRNRIIDLARKNKKHQEYLQTELLTALPTAPDPEADQYFKQYNQAAQKALQEMTEKRRTVFQLHTQQDMTLNEISKSLGISRSTTKKHLYAATRLIREALRRNGDFISIVLLALSFRH